MRYWCWKIPRSNACGCRCHVSDNVWAEANFLCNMGMPTLAPTERPFEPGNERNKPSWRLGFEVLLKSLRFSPCGPLSAALNKRGFVRSATEALVKLVGHRFLCAHGSLKCSPPDSLSETQRCPLSSPDRERGDTKLKTDYSFHVPGRSQEHFIMFSCVLRL